MSVTTAEPAAMARKRPFFTPHRRQAALGYLFLLPWVIGFLGLTLGPMLFSLYASFTDYNIVNPPTWIGLDNYKNIFIYDSEDFHTALYNTFWYVIVKTPLAIAFALLLALLLNMKLRGVNLFRTIFYSPTVLGGVSAAFLWIWVLNPQGLINRGLAFLHVAGPNWFYDPNWTKPGMVVMSLWFVGGGMIILLAGLNAVPRTLYEAASIDGANGWTQFWRITMPLLSPALFYMVVTGIIGAFQVFTNAMVISQTVANSPGAPAKSLLFYELLIYINAWQSLKMGYSAALSWILFAIIMIITGFNLWLSKRWVYYEG